MCNGKRYALESVYCGSPPTLGAEHELQNYQNAFDSERKNDFFSSDFTEGVCKMKQKQ